MWKKLRYVHFPEICEKMRQHAKYARAVFKCVEALGRIIIRGSYPPSNPIVYMHLHCNNN